jgi:phosphomevalonate kinase
VYAAWRCAASGRQRTSLMVEVTRSWSAPGKLVIIGEYAVLAGHAAVVTAVDVRAQASRSSGPLRIALDEGGLLQACMDALLQAGVQPARGSYHIDTDAFARGGQKLGVGSSSAACVAFLAAAMDLHNDDDRDALWRCAVRAHDAFGGGSGIDIAAAVHGGWLSFQRRDEQVECKPCAPPPNSLQPLVVWTGHSQNTRPFVAAVRELVTRDASQLEPMAEAVHRYLEGCRNNDATVVLSSVDAARHAMQHLGHAAGIDIVSAAHQHIARIVAQHGGAAKPSGAGGGDVALAFVERSVVATAQTALQAAGFPCVDVALAVDGVLSSD